MNLFATHGAVSWTELMTSDVPAALAFYQSLFGWQIIEEAMEGGVYHTIQAGEAKIGGIMAQPPQATDMPPMWGSYVTVDDIEATTAKVTELGGQVLLALKEIPGIGRFSVIQDPQGAVIMAIAYEQMEQ